jgi:hypothetical protein
MGRMRCCRMHFVFVSSLISLFTLRAPQVLAADPLMATLQPATVQAWDAYLQWADRKVRNELSASGNFLIRDYLSAEKQAAVRNSLQSGEIYVDRVQGVIPPGTKFSVEDGEIHHWWGTILIPGTTIERTVQFLQDYDHHASRFADLEQSRIIARKNQEFRVYLRLRRSAALVTAYYNTEEECTWTSFGPQRYFSRSNATRIAELENPATPQEREKSPGQDRGFLWRLTSWWRIEQTERGVVVEIESASLSRDIPTIARIIPGVTAYINSLPKDSLRSILTSIRNNLK